MTNYELAQIIWDYMRYEQPLEKSDIIVGFGSSDVRTAEHCARLWHDGFADTIVFCGARGRITRDVFTENEAGVYAKRAIELGVPRDRIVVEHRSTNSGENVKYLYETVHNLGLPYQKIILVHKPYMLRRAYATLMQQWPETKKPTVICSSIDEPLDTYTQDTLYPFDYVTNVMVGDLQRIREYPKRGFQVEQYIPDGVWAAWQELVARGYTRYLLQ